MSLCFVDPADAIRAISDSIGREARRQLLGEAVRAWVDEIPDSELEVHYAKAIAELDEHDLRGEEAGDAGVTEDDALVLFLGLLAPPRLMALAVEAVELYIWDRAGSDN